MSIYLGVDIPRIAVCEHHVAPFTAFANAYFARDSIAVWKAARGFGGKTMLLALLTLTEAITLGAYCNLLGGSGEQSQRVNAYLNGEDVNVSGMFLEAPLAPRDMIQGSFKKEVRFTNGGLVKALMASSRSVRGPHPQRLRLDEIDEMEQNIFDSAMGQTMGARGIAPNTVASSTHQHPNGTMTEALARAKQRAWGSYEWCWRESLEPHGWLSEDAVRTKKLEVPTAMWWSEYEGQEPNPAGRVFSDEVIEFLFQDRLGTADGAEWEDCRFIDPGPGVFYHGTDWAKTRDWTIVHSMKENAGGPDQLAAWIRVGRKPWPDMVEVHNRRVEDYGGKSWHDSTGVGDVVNDYLTVDSTGFNFSAARARNDMLNKYIAACEAGEFEYPRIRFMLEQHKYLTLDEVYGSGHLPDSVVAAALAYRAKGKKSHRGLLVARI